MKLVYIVEFEDGNKVHLILPEKADYRDAYFHARKQIQECNSDQIMRKATKHSDAVKSIEIKDYSGADPTDNDLLAQQQAEIDRCLFFVELLDRSDL